GTSSSSRRAHSIASRTALTNSLVGPSLWWPLRARLFGKFVGEKNSFGVFCKSSTISAPNASGREFSMSSKLGKFSRTGMAKLEYAIFLTGPTGQRRAGRVRHDAGVGARGPREEGNEKQGGCENKSNVPRVAHLRSSSSSKSRQCIPVLDCQSSKWRSSGCWSSSSGSGWQ